MGRNTYRQMGKKGLHLKNTTETGGKMDRELAVLIERRLAASGDRAATGGNESIDGVVAARRQGREVRPRLDYDICGMCGRTILTGESIDLFTAPADVKPMVVCRHCRDAARQAGYNKVA